MIKSKRKFGIEIEFVTTSEDNFAKIARNMHVVADGSLRPLANAAEYVSDILSGASGEREVRRVCEILKKYQAGGEHPKTSVHVHLDGMKDAGTLRSSSTLPDNAQEKGVVAFSNRCKEKIGTRNISSLLFKGHWDDASVVDYMTATFDGVRYFSLARLSNKPKANYTYYWVEYKDRFNWLRNVLYFYTKFSPTMEAIVSNSRKVRNMYCIPLGESYELSDIAACQNIRDVRNVWYKGRSGDGHYDDSRYHNVNLHSFWDRHGTVEIRSHGGTIDANKILLWVRLHQHIVDKLENVEFDELVAMGSDHRDFLNFIEDEMLKAYVKRLLGYYSGIKI